MPIRQAHEKRPAGAGRRSRVAGPAYLLLLDELELPLVEAEGEELLPSPDEEPLLPDAPRPPLPLEEPRPLLLPEVPLPLLPPEEPEPPLRLERQVLNSSENFL